MTSSPTRPRSRPGRRPTSDATSVSVTVSGSIGLAAGAAFSDASVDSRAVSRGIDGGDGSDVIVNTGEIVSGAGATGKSTSVSVNVAVGAGGGATFSDSSALVSADAAGIDGGPGTTGSSTPARSRRMRRAMRMSRAWPSRSGRPSRQGHPSGTPPSCRIRRQGESTGEKATTRSTTKGRSSCRGDVPGRCGLGYRQRRHGVGGGEAADHIGDDGLGHRGRQEATTGSSTRGKSMSGRRRAWTPGCPGSRPAASPSGWQAWRTPNRPCWRRRSRRGSTAAPATTGFEMKAS